MPSPFPGMDPYLEGHWRDVHASLIVYLADAIEEQLPRDLVPRINERLVLAGPARSEPATETFIELIDIESGRHVVTLIEILCPTNKLPGEGRDSYLRKQADLCRSDTNLVEIDLLRQGRHTCAFPLANLLPARRTAYYVCVRRATALGRAEIYPTSLEERLPTFKLPLRQQDADIRVDLQALLDQVYNRGRYEGDIDYTKDPEPPLTPRGAAWVQELLVGKGLRQPTPAPTRRKKRKRPEA